MSNVSNLNALLTQGAIAGFTSTFASINVYGYAVKPGAAAVGNQVRVPYSTNISSSSTFNYTTGYTTNSAYNTTGKTVTLDTVLYQPITLTDSDLLQLNDESIIAVGQMAGSNLAADVISNIYSNVITTGNFPVSASYTSAQFTSSAALVALNKQATDLKFPNQNRGLIMGTALEASLLSNPAYTEAYRIGNNQAITTGNLTSLFGFTPFTTNISLPNSNTGFLVNPNAILIGNGYHAPQDSGTAYVSANQIVDEQSDLTIGFRQWYAPGNATSYRVFDCLFGSALGNPNALIQIK